MGLVHSRKQTFLNTILHYGHWKDLIRKIFSTGHSEENQALAEYLTYEIIQHLYSRGESTQVKLIQSHWDDIKDNSFCSQCLDVTCDGTHKVTWIW